MERARGREREGQQKQKGPGGMQLEKKAGLSTGERARENIALKNDPRPRSTFSDGFLPLHLVSRSEM